MQAPTGDDLTRVKRAAEEAAWLAARGYPADAVAAFVATHRQLTDADRMLLDCNSRLCRNVKHHIAREMEPDDVSRRPLRIDAENVLCGVAAARADALMLESPAGVWCDPTWQRGATTWNDAVQACLDDVCGALASLRPKQISWLVPSAWHADLEAALGPPAKKHKLKGEVLSGDVSSLSGGGFVVSADPAVLDSCASWVNLLPLVVAGSSQALRLED